MPLRCTAAHTAGTRASGTAPSHRGNMLLCSAECASSAHTVSQ